MDATARPEDGQCEPAKTEGTIKVQSEDSAYLYDLHRKRRKPNFTEPELLTLVELWAQYKTILRGPATDTVMRSTKARVWRKVSAFSKLSARRYKK